MEQRRTTPRALACWLGASAAIHLSIALALAWGIDPLPIYASLPHVVGSLLAGTGIVVGAMVWGRPGGALPPRPRAAVAAILLGYVGYAVVGFLNQWMLMLALLGGLVATIPLVAFVVAVVLTPSGTGDAPAEAPSKRRVPRPGRDGTAR